MYLRGEARGGTGFAVLCYWEGVACPLFRVRVIRGVAKFPRFPFHFSAFFLFFHPVGGCICKEGRITRNLFSNKIQGAFYNGGRVCMTLVTRPAFSRFSGFVSMSGGSRMSTVEALIGSYFVRNSRRLMGGGFQFLFNLVKRLASLLSPTETHSWVGEVLNNA